VLRPKRTSAPEQKSLPMMTTINQKSLT
jgi:hypothetical protein